jgi:hypothetical protein
MNHRESGGGFLPYYLVDHRPPWLANGCRQDRFSRGVARMLKQHTRTGAQTPARFRHTSAGHRNGSDRGGHSGGNRIKFLSRRASGWSRCSRRETWSPHNRTNPSGCADRTDPARPEAERTRGPQLRPYSYPTAACRTGAPSAGAIPPHLRRTADRFRSRWSGRRKWGRIPIVR